MFSGGLQAMGSLLLCSFCAREAGKRLTEEEDSFLGLQSLGSLLLSSFCMEVLGSAGMPVLGALLYVE